LSDEPQERKPRQVKVKVPEDDRHGTYANFLVVSHSPHEFTLDFCQLLPSQDSAETTAEVVSRIRIAPTLVGRVIQALNSNMTNYEDRFGPISIRE
jgi:hypothetical protein